MECAILKGKLMSVIYFMSSSDIFNVIAIGLIFFSLVGFFVHATGAIFHLLLVIMIIAILLSIVQATRVVK